MVQCLLDDRDMLSVCVCTLVLLYPSIFVYAILIIAYLCNNFDQTDDIDKTIADTNLVL